MFCPKCRAEYIPGYTRCSDCRVPLVDQLPPQSKRERQPRPPDSLVTVLATGDFSLMAIAKSLLQSAGIPFTTQGEGIQTLFGAGCIGTGFNLITGPAKLQVAASDALEAREILADLIADLIADQNAQA